MGSEGVLVAPAQRRHYSHYGVCLQYFSGISASSFVDTPIFVCYGLMLFITYQPNTRLAVKSSAGKEGRQPTAFLRNPGGRSDQPGEVFRTFIVVGVITGTDS